jgi:hypothetical protein
VIALLLGISIKSEGYQRLLEVLDSEEAKQKMAQWLSEMDCRLRPEPYP